MDHVTISEDGGWCWFQDPRALRHVDTRDVTYVGWISRTGDVQVGEVNHETGAISSTTLHAAFEPDDHDDPTLAIREDGRIIVFYTRHAGASVRYRIGASPEDISQFGPEHQLTPGSSPRVTYPNPRWIGDDLHLFLRNNGTLVDLVSSDGGDTWSAQREIVSTDGRGWCIYTKLSRSIDGEVHLGMTHALGGTTQPHRHIYHARFDGEAVRRSDGTIVGKVGEDSLPVSMYETTPVVDSRDTGDDAWIWDCATIDGLPQLVYARLPSPDTHQYRYAWWDGVHWREEPVCDAGGPIVASERSEEQYYSGGIALDHDVAGVCYAAIGDHAGSAITRFERSNGRWHSRPITSETVQNIRPVVPWNRGDELAVCWARGRYDHFAPVMSDGEAAFRTNIVGTSR